MAIPHLSGIMLIDGSASAPALAFNSDTNTGIYRSAADTLNVSINGGSMFAVNSSGITSGVNVYTGTNGQFRNYAGVWKGTTGLSGGDAQFILNGKTIMHIDEADERIGVGNTDPKAKLHITGSDSTESAIRQSRTGVSKIWDQAIDSSGRLAWGHRTSESGTRTTVLTIDDDNKVGIMRDNPLYPLHVVGSAYVNQGSLFIDSGKRLKWGNSNQFIEGTDDTSLEFGTGGGTKMIILNNGNVGINNTNPSRKLIVNGTTQFYEYGGSHLTNQAHSTYLFDTLVTDSSSNHGSGLGAYVKLTASATNATGTYSTIRTRSYAENTTVNTERLINFFAEYNNYTSTSSVTLNNHIRFYADTLGVGGNATVTNNYGFFANPGTAATNNYGFYQSGSAVKNYFQGKVGIGILNPQKELHIDGHALISAERYYYVAGVGAGMGSDSSGNLILRQNSGDLMTTDSNRNVTFTGSITGKDSGIIIDSISGPYGRIHGTSSIFLGGSSTSNVQLSAQLIPDADSARSLGNSGRYWSNAYIDQITTTGNVNVGGTISSGKHTITKSSSHTAQGSFSASNAHLDLYNSLEANTDQKGSIITFTDNYFDGTNYIKTTRAGIKGGTDTTGNTADGYLEFYTDSAAANSPNLALRLDRNQNATFTGAINLDSSHINIDGNGAVIFDNTNNNNAWYIRNGGTNAATLQFGLGTPGANIKHTFAGNGDVTFAGHVLPTNDSTKNLGSDAKRWAAAYVDSLSATLTATISGDLRIQSDLSVLNKAQTAYIDVATRNTSGSEVVYDLGNIGDVHTEGRVRIQGGTDNGSQLNLFCDSSGDAHLSAYTFSINTGGNNSRTQSLKIDHNKNATFTGNITAAFDSNNSGNRLRIADTEGISAAVRTYSTSDGTGLILNHYYAVSGSPYMRYSDFVSNMGDAAATTMRFLTKPHNGNPTVALTIDNSQNSTFAGSVTATDYRSSSHIYLTSSDSWIFRSTGGTERARIKSNGFLGIGTNNPDEKLHVMYQHADGAPTTYARSVIEDTDAQLDLLSTSSGTWGSAINFVEAAGSGANTDVWSIARKTTGGVGDSSLNFNFGTSNQHDNTNRVSFSSTGNATFGGNILPTTDAAQTIGGSSKRWNFGYFNNTISVTDGNISAGTDFDFNQGATFAGTLTVEGDEFTLGNGAYQTVLFDTSPSSVIGTGTMQIQPTTIPGSGTANFTTYFKNNSGGGTTKHHIKVDGDVNAGSYQVSGTTRIDSAGKFFPTSINGTGKISFLNGSSAQGARVSSLYAGTTYANDGSAAGTVDVLNGYRVQGTTVIDTNRNFIGNGNLFLRSYNDSGEGIFFRNGFEYGDGNEYNLSITILNDGDGSADALEINAYDGIYFNTGSNSQNIRAKIDSTGNATFYNDVTVNGNLNIVGDIDSYNVNNLDVVDKLITIGKGQIESASNGSGIIVDGSNASLLWDETNNTWDFNKSLDIVGNITASGNITTPGNIILSGAANEIIKSNGSIRLNIDSDNNQGDRVFIVSHHSNTELFRVDEGGHGTFQGNVKVGNALIDSNSTTSATTTTTVASVDVATYGAAFFDYSIKNGTNVRAGTVVATHDGTNVEFNETSTVDLGDTSDVTLSVDISGGNMRLRATTASSTWTIKALIRGI